MTNAIRITSRSPGFRRAGIAHPAGPVEHPAGAFTPEQIAQLLDEPRLVVELLIDGEPIPADQVAQLRKDLERFLAGEISGTDDAGTDFQGAPPDANAPAAQGISSPAQGQTELSVDQDPKAPAGGTEGIGSAGAAPEGGSAKAASADGAAPVGNAEAPKAKPSSRKGKG